MDIRRARRSDAAAVAAFTEETWAHGDYAADVFEGWVESDGADRRTLVAADEADEAVGVVQGVLLSEHEAWVQGLRVAPDARGSGTGSALLEAALDWAAERGAAVARCMVFSWNVQGLGGTRAVGFEPTCEFRWIHPEPDAGATPVGDVRDDPDAAWAFWSRSAARDRLAGLALDDDEPWALAELTRERLHEAAREDRLLVCHEAGVGTRGVALRARTDGLADGERAEYAVAAWRDGAACRDVLAAVARDAAAQDAEEARVLIPETARAVSDVATARVDVGDEPDFVLTCDLSART
ncbi:N-acetyltransferase [Halarchaeum grantii]|uniref:N-acetyltransferase n=1 Tax=Halarchaeum grantii TaxID=1193105 RepID=A0A830FAE1_9EURY|nr:GNAT family N-acetyltransferase [Halarchaeum grantii]GGL26908.1 N-acetyltransferase [Halarchaeum grantii]